MKRIVHVLPLFCVAASLFAAGELDLAKKQYARTQYREAVQTLSPLGKAGDAEALFLTGKAWFMLAEYKRAQEAFEKAVERRPDDSSYHHWLGKAFGRRAETSSPFTAPLLASKARKSFEKAVELDGRNNEAVNDLFTYYLEAPGFLGGGLDKATALAERIQALDKAEYHYALAQIAEKRKETRTAEFHFRQAFQLAPRSVGRAIDLARFLSKQGRLQESETVFAQAEKIAPDSPRLLFERASAYVRAKKNLSEAKQMLEQYLRAPLTPDDPPRAEAERLLRQAVQAGAA
jgi:tetratricopeptide (TPR) repeat protein